MRMRGRKDDGLPGWSLFRPRFVLGLAAATLIALSGCRSNQKSALVEAELRTREREVRALRSDLQRSEMFNGALTREIQEDRPVCIGPPVPPSAGVVDGPAAVMSGMVKQVTLGRGTGGLDDDGWPGDEALQVVVVPQDVDGSAVKVPGTLVVQAFEITSGGLKLPLSRWEVPALQLQRSWRSGLFSTGYFVTLPWKTWPASEKLRVVVQFFTLPDNRAFEVDRDVTVKLVPGGARRSAQPAPGVEVLPPPGIIIPRVREFPPPPGDDGPILMPGAWFRQRDPAARLEAAKPAPERGPARLLEPRLREDDADQSPQVQP